VKRRDLTSSLGAVAVAVALDSCFRPEEAAVERPGPDLGEPVQFTFGTIDGGELSSDTTRGRTTALLFVTTYDLPSQAEAQLLRDALSTHKPLANGGIVMLEAPQAAPLARVWAESIGMKLPIAMASPSLLSGESQLGHVAGVPTLLVLDRRGRLRSRNEGSQTREEIEACLQSADER
jgi:hypothetical protein